MLNYINIATVTCVYMLMLHSTFGAVLFTTGEELIFTHSAELDNNGLAKLNWLYNETYIIFELEVKTTGWIAMGISPTGSMAGADIMCMWMEGSKPVLKDMYAEYNGLPIEDMSQDLLMVSGSQSGGFTTVKFGRTLDACDEDDNAISETTLRVIYAYGTKNPVKELTYEDKHQVSNRGSRSIRLLNQIKEPITPNDPDMKVTDLVNDEVKVPSSHTYYHCKIHKVDLNKKKHHVIQFEPFVEEENEAVVHHIVIYECVGLNDSMVADGYGHECFSPNMPSDYKKCTTTTLFAWAVGGGVFTYPENAGLPLDDSTQPVYLLTETHYDNPEKKTGIVDSSGIRILSTPNLREQDVGSLTAGAMVSESLFIPAGAQNWIVTGTCSSGCLSSGFPEGQDSVKVIATMVHAHLFGFEIKVHHYRNGVELKPLSEEKYYDFNYQEYNHFPEEITIMKGDELMVECVYKTEDTPVFGGFQTEDEMCAAFIQYYPKLDISQCVSMPEFTSLYTMLEIPESVWEEEFQQFIELPSVVATVTEGDFDVEELNEQYNELPYTTICVDSKINAEFSNHNRTDKIPYVYPEPNCPGSGYNVTPSVLTMLSAVSILAFLYKD